MLLRTGRERCPAGGGHGGVVDGVDGFQQCMKSVSSTQTAAKRAQQEGEDLELVTQDVMCHVHKGPFMPPHP